MATMQSILKSCQAKCSRRSNGISLMYVLVVGAITASAAIALGASLFPTLKHVSSLSIRDDVVGIAENSMEYAFKKLNALGRTEELQFVESSQLTPPETITNKAVVNLALENADNSELINRNLISPSKYQLNGTAFNPTFRILSVSAAKNGYKHTIRVILAPVYIPLIGVGSPNQTGANPSPSSSSTPLFSKALQSGQSLYIGDSVRIGMQNNDFIGADIGGNGIAQIGANTQIGGNLSIYTPALGGATPTSIKASLDNVTVNGNVSSSGNIVDSAGSTTAPFSSDASGGNVLGDGIKNATTPTFGTINNSATQFFAPGIDTPISTSIAQVSYSGTEPSAIAMAPTSSAASIADLGNLTVKSGTTVTIEPGAYVADSVTVESGGTLKIVDSTNSSFTGVELFVQGNGAESSPINIQGNVSFDAGVSSSSTNFQMFYGGNKNVNFSLPNSSTFRGLVYAPNATMAVEFGTNTTFNGAVVANGISLAHKQGASNGAFLFDSNASKPGSPAKGIASAPAYDPPPPTSTPEPSVKSYRIITWQELSNK